MASSGESNRNDVSFQTQGDVDTKTTTDTHQAKAGRKTQAPLVMDAWDNADDRDARAY